MPECKLTICENHTLDGGSVIPAYNRITFSGVGCMCRVYMKGANHDIGFDSGGNIGHRWCDTVQTFNSCTIRPDVCQCLVVHTSIDNPSKNKPSTSMTQVACELKLRSVERSSMHPRPRNWVAVRRAALLCQGCPRI